MQLPAHCVTTAAELLELRYDAAVLLLYAMAQAGAATASLVVVPPSCVGRFLALFAQMLGMLTLAHLSLVFFSVLYATGAICSGGMVDLIFAGIFAYIFVYAVPILWIISQEPDDP